MKLPNGFGSVYKLSGKRRNPWVAAKTFGWDYDEEKDKYKQVQKPIGYYPTRPEALTALVNYNENPYDLETDTITFEQVYEEWSEGYFSTLGSQSSIRTVTAAYNHCKPLYKMKMKDIRVNHLEQTIKDAVVGNSTKSRMKSLFNLMYRYAMKHEIVDKNYAALCDSVKQSQPKIVRIPFSDNELTLLWNNTDFPFVDMVLIGVYSGWRPQELAILRIEDIDLDEQLFKGGLKTNAGKNRIVPIHPIILDLVKLNYEKAVAMNSEYLFNDEDGQQGTFLTYDKYRGRFNKIMKRFKIMHKPHDTRHSFITKAKAASMDEYIIKLIVGHAITDITEKTYTHRTIEQLHTEIAKIKS
ncbi:MAG: tyrosine-type recombinase/integrase [Lachnotalea sp.]